MVSSIIFFYHLQTLTYDNPLVSFVQLILTLL